MRQGFLLLLVFLLFASLVNAWIQTECVSRRQTVRRAAKEEEQDSSSRLNYSELTSRIQSLQKAEEQLNQDFLKVPVICFDSLLPGQVMEGRTTDATFCRLFQSTLGLGGRFCMVSLNFKTRMIRRHGVLCQVDYMDATTTEADQYRTPTAVDFRLRGIQRCRVMGSPSGMRVRIGRWRRSYDENGEEAVLGWGEERFADNPAASELTITLPGDQDEQLEEKVTSSSSQPHTVPSESWVDCRLDQDEETNQEEYELVQNIIPLLKTWEQLASDPQTYECTNVVASTRVAKGFPGLRVNPAALIRQVKQNLGEMPGANSPTDFAVWGSALINPLPALGVSPEIRGRVLEAPTVLEKLRILEWGVNRSIQNLKGTHPL